ncbi:helix-turn-helix domain-containing protein [Pseudactinotalea suaedae]|uniref:helix-turn-helix domain-containing protein n=1 Tax=Pseudactinotalea suaedae TaxID=1524924 RepID=UPI0012E26BB8|nr:AraC family transcriptional regulator [Pseudactinotalea suaedae]
MIFVQRPAPARLAGIATRLWFIEAVPVARYEKILPMPSVHVIANLSDPYRIVDRAGTAALVSHVFVSGLQNEYLVIESPDPIRHVGVELTATGLGALAPDAPRETAGHVGDASAHLVGLAIIAARIGRIADPDRILSELEDYLLALPQHPTDPLAEAAVRMLEEESERPVSDIALALGVSHRALVSRFRRATGTTPKLHAQVLRFHRLLDAVHASDGRPEWSTLAVASGYYDQPHVIREFRRFSGWTPVEYIRLVAEHGPDAARFVPLAQVPT